MFIAGFALAHVGEFAFILSAVGASSGLITEQGSRLIVAVIACSLVLSPFWLQLARRLHTLEGPSGEHLTSLLTWLYQDEARQLRLRSRRVAARRSPATQAFIVLRRTAPRTRDARFAVRTAAAR